MERIRRIMILVGLVVIGGASGCSGDSGPPSGTGGQGGGGGGGLGTGGGPNGSGGAVGSGGTTSTVTYPNSGVCGARGTATADPTSFDGYEERFIIGEDGFGSDVCAVRFDLKRVGAAPGGCADCTWSQLLEYSNPRVVTDTDGVCAKSELGLDAPAIAKIAGTRVALGFAKELGGAHGSARMLFVEATQKWDVFGNATWDEASKAFKFDYRAGLCTYGP